MRQLRFIHFHYEPMIVPENNFEGMQSASYVRFLVLIVTVRIFFLKKVGFAKNLTRTMKTSPLVVQI